MSGQLPGRAREDIDTPDDVAWRDDRIADLEQSQRRLQRLFDISKLLTRFPGFEQTVAEVFVLIADALPLRGAVVILETGGSPHMLTWQAAGENGRGVKVARARAQRVYRDLNRSRVELDEDLTAPTTAPQPPATATETRMETTRNFVMLPLAVDHGSILGALQIENCAEMTESDLFFINAVVNQLAIALDRDAADRALRTSEANLEVANSELREALAREQLMARTDGLTGLDNRRHFLEAAAHEWAVARRYGLPLAMMWCHRGSRWSCLGRKRTGPREYVLLYGPRRAAGGGSSRGGTYRNRAVGAAEFRARYAGDCRVRRHRATSACTRSKSCRQGPPSSPVTPRAYFPPRWSRNRGAGLYSRVSSTSCNASAVIGS